MAISTTTAKAGKAKGGKGEMDKRQRTWDGGNRGECEVGIAWRNCGSGRVCWRTVTDVDWDRPSRSTWYGYAICVPDNECLPRYTWAFASAVRRSRMNEKCCSGATWRIGNIAASLGFDAFRLTHVCL